MDYRFMPFLMTLNDLKGHLPVARFSDVIRRVFDNCAAFNKIPTDIARRAVPPRQVSLLFETDAVYRCTVTE